MNQEFKKKNSSVFCRKTKASYLMRETLLVQKVAYSHAVFSRKRMVSVSFISFEKFELRMRKNFSTNFSYLFFAQKVKYEKKIRVISD